MEQALVQYGAVGVLLAAFVALFLGIFRVLFARLLRHFDVQEETLKNLAGAFAAFSHKVETNHQQILDKLRERKAS